MTATTDLAALIPVLLITGTGSEVMSRLAAPLVGGMVTAIMLTLLLVPAVYLLWKLLAIDAVQLPAQDTVASSPSNMA
jgi:Cu(I)/Ag(I) efflux system membrane protein CusA/SilA